MRVVGGVDPVGLHRRQGRLRNHLQVLVADGLRDGVGGGEHRDLKLLVPELRLRLLDLRVQAIRLVVQFQPLLAKLQQDHTDRGGTEEAEEDFAGVDYPQLSEEDYAGIGGDPFAE